MNENSKAKSRGSRAEFVLTNLLPQYKLLEVRIVGKDRSPVESSVDILGWLVRDGRSIPITLFGVHEPKDGCHYAILNTVDKTHTELDGTQYPDYKSFMAPKWDAFERAEPEAQAPAPSAPVAPRESTGPQAWKAMRGSKP